MAIDNIARITPEGVESYSWDEMPEDIRLELELTLMQKGL
jgi:hypothetical protein